jgi:hypothetical protein
MEFKNLARILLAFPKPLSISLPEWPPLNPFTFTLNQKYFLGASFSLYLKYALVPLPPAHQI